MIANQYHNTKLKSKGFTLLEVMIAVFVLAIGLLGLASLQMISLKNNHSAQYRTSATVITYDIIDRMRLNRTADYTTTFADDPSTISGSTLNGTDLIAWKTALEELPEGKGSVTINGDIVTVAVQWNDSRGSNGSDTQSFTVSSER